jgi:hypothetical protein
MAKTTVAGWDTTAANNSDIDSTDISGATGKVKDGDNALRSVMAQIAAFTGSDTIASATTTDMSTVAGQYVTVTGITTVTGLGTIKAGWLKFLKFSGALILTHNATSLILPGAANITTAAGDVAVMVSEGSGNWRCLDYQRAAGGSNFLVTTDNALARFDGTSGQMQNSAVTVSDNGEVTVSTSSGVPLLLDRTASSINAATQYRTTAGSVYSGNGSGTEFVIGNDPNISTTGRWLVVNGTTTSTAGAFTTTSTSNTGSYNGGAFSSTGASAGFRIINGNLYQSSVATTAATGHLGFFNPNGAVGTINTSASSTAYNTSSDSRLKDNFADFDADAILAQMAIYQYTWKADGSTGYGPKAQELHAVFPNAVTPGNDLEPGNEGFIPWGYDASKLVPLLIKSAQSMKATIAALEARVAALEP